MSHGIIFQVLKANINYWGNIDFKLGDRDDLLWKHKLQWSKKVCTVKLLHAMQLPSPMRHIIHSEDGRLNPTFSVFSGIKRKHWEKVKKIFSMNPSKLLVGHKNLKRNYPMKNFQLKRKTIPPIRNLSSHYLDVKSTSSQNSFSTWHHGDICDTEENLKNIWKANFKTDSFKFESPSRIYLKVEIVTASDIYIAKHFLASDSLRVKFPYSELFWSAFSSIRNEYGKIRCRITPNTDTFHAFYYFTVCNMNGTSYLC